MKIVSNPQDQVGVTCSTTITTDGTTTDWMYPYTCCKICHNDGWYKDYNGIWHRCPKCTCGTYKPYWHRHSPYTITCSL